MNPTLESWQQHPIESLLPHTPPLVLLDRIVKLAAESIRCETRFVNDGFFQDAEGVPVAWAVEIVAQACAVMVAIQCYGSGITQGRLLKCRSFEFHAAHLPYDALLEVDARLTMKGDSGLWFFSGAITDPAGTQLAEGEMTIQVQ